MKRLLVLVAVLVPLSLFIAGCGGKGGSGGSSDAKSMQTPEKMQEMMQRSKEMPGKAARK